MCWHVLEKNAWRYKDLLIACYSNVAGDMNKTYCRKTKNRLEYVEPFSAFGFMMLYGVGLMANGNPYFVINEREFMRLERKQGIRLGRIKRNKDKFSYAFFESREEAKKVRVLVSLR